MKASTHTEVYRPFRGQLTSRRLRFAPLLAASLRTAMKKKLPLVLLLAPLVIGTIIFSFTVYAGFAIQEGLTPSALGSKGGVAGMIETLMSQRAKQLAAARDMVVNFHLATNGFAVLLMAWYGAGVLAEDRRLKAHLLYFARPLSRFDYLLAKFLTIAFFGVLSTVLPGLIICTVATFASPEWSFLREEYDVILATLGFGLMSTVLVSSIVFCVSSLATRHTFALIGVFATFGMTHALSGILSALLRERDYHMLSPLLSTARIATSMFQIRDGAPVNWSLNLAWISVAAYVALAWFIVWVRTRRLDIVQ